MGSATPICSYYRRVVRCCRESLLWNVIWDVVTGVVKEVCGAYHECERNASSFSLGATNLGAKGNEGTSRVEIVFLRRKLLVGQ